MMLAFMRIIEADKDDFELLTSCSSSTMFRSIRDAQVAVSVKNEQRVMMSLVALCDRYLNQYPTTYEADIDRLANGNIPPFSNERHALIQAFLIAFLFYYFDRFHLIFIFSLIFSHFLKTYFHFLFSTFLIHSHFSFFFPSCYIVR
jgi:hypothetical protein